MRTHVGMAAAARLWENTARKHSERGRRILWGLCENRYASYWKRCCERTWNERKPAVSMGGAGSTVERNGTTGGKHIFTSCSNRITFELTGTLSRRDLCRWCVVVARIPAVLCVVLASPAITCNGGSKVKDFGQIFQF